jgi:hypothetical protein
VALLVSCQTPHRGPVASHRLHGALSEAAAAWDQLAAGKGGSEVEAAYERAVETVLVVQQRASSPRTWTGASVPVGSGAEGFEWRAVAAADVVTVGEVSANLADEIRLASKVKLDRGETLAAGEGLGVPAVVRRARDAELVKKYPFLPPNGANLPVTAMIEFGRVVAGEPRVATLRLYRPQAERMTPVVKVGGKERAMAWNYTAAVQMAMNDGTLDKFGLRGMLKPETTLDACQIYRLDNYDPQRIPVVFVHGLVSDPHIWCNAINAIYADPELRRAYQPWYFMYPTGLNIATTSRHLREWLDKSREKLDPDHNDPGMNEMVLVGHSMGGLLSRMQVSDPGDRLWDAFFKVPPEKLRMSESDRKQFVSSLRFERRPWVKRAIFVATPHRGSRLANIGIVRWATKLVKLPGQSLSLLSNVVQMNTDSIAAEMKDMANFISVGNLSPSHPFYKGLESVPVGVPHHSVIGDRGKGGGVNSTDGVVPYWSSHLASAASETFVPYPHSCVEKPETVEEIVRLLKLHLKTAKRGGK